MNNKKTLIISILAMLGIIALFVAIILFILNNREKQLQENMKAIKSNYANFSTNIADNEQLRSNLTKHINEFDATPYEDEIGKYEDTLRKYDKNIQYLDSLVKDMESRCKYKYDDLNIQILCKGYDGLYEATVNKYITKIIEYNNKVTEYNQKANTTYEIHYPVHETLLDYNKDGKYSGTK